MCLQNVTLERLPERNPVGPGNCGEPRGTSSTLEKRMLHRTRNLVVDWRSGDAEKLVAMEMESESAWPGGGGWQTSTEEQERWIRESDLIGAFVTEEGERMVSMCTLNAKPGQRAHAFIPHLNCHPAYHGKKYGKSVLRAAVERAYEEGYGKVDLYTWPGNLKAVPLYKKMGFMWRPDSSVQMENFTLAARRYPLGARYFARHDWYETQVRALELKEDLVERGKVKVYEYLWRAEDGEFLRIVFDRQSWGIIEVENGELAVSSSLPEEKLVAGVPHTVRWRIVNKRPDPVGVFLNASGDPGVEIRKHEAFEVKDAVELEGTFTIDPEIPKKTREPKAAILRTDLVIDGVPIELAAGIGVQQAIAVSLEVVRSIVAPGEHRHVVLSLGSNLKEKSTAHLSVLPAGGAAVERREHVVVLDPEGRAELSVPLTAETSGPVALDVQTSAAVDGERIPVKTKRLDLLAVEPEEVSGGIGEETALLCGGGLTVYVSLTRGEFDVHHRLRGERAHRLHVGSPRLGPPFSWEDFFEEKAEASIERDGYGIVLRLRTKSILRPGVVLDRRVRLGPSPLVKVTDTIINGAARPLDLSLIQGVSAGAGPRAEFVIPRKDGVYREAAGAGGRSLDRLRIPEEGDQWPEGWFCAQRGDGCATGVLWRQAERIEAGHWGELRLKVGHLEPGRSKTLEPIHFFVGDGNWQTVQGWWRTLFGDVPEVETPHAPTRRPIELGITPSPLLVSGEDVDATVFVRSVGEYKLDGKIAMDLPEALRSDLESIEVSGLCEADPVARKMRLKRTEEAPSGPGHIAMRFEHEEAVYRSQESVLVLPSDAPDVRVSKEEGGKVVVVDNGILTAKVAPGFLGSGMSLQRDGREFLNSSYPEASIRGWANPWHGGISPEYGRLWGNLHKERFRYRVIERRGHQGFVWRGVRVHCVIQQERARGQSIALEYLLAPGADVLAIIPSCRDEFGLSSSGRIGFNLNPSFAASPGTASFHTAVDEGVTPLAAPHWAGAGTWDWGILLGENGQSLFLSGKGDGVHTSGSSFGNEGCALNGSVERHMPAGGRVEGLFFVAPTFGLEDAKTHTVWSEFEEMP